MTTEEMRNILKETPLEKMTLQELVQFRNNALKLADDVTSDLIQHETNLGAQLKFIRDSMTEKEYRSILRRAKIKIKDAREMIMLSEVSANYEGSVES